MAMENIQPASVVSQISHDVHGKLTITELFFDVPLDYENPERETLRIFARAARMRETPLASDGDRTKTTVTPPWLLYLRGGPGSGCDPPQTHPQTSIFIDRGYQMLYLDARGTGLSTPITSSTLNLRGPVEAQTKYLTLFRADNIVRDCEAIRLALTAGEKWSSLGQSFGGFCTTTYLSFHPEGLRECFVFGGLPPLVDQPDELYRSLAQRVIAQNQHYYAKYPEDVESVRKIMRHLRESHDSISLPSNGTLTRRRFRQIGINLGFHGGFQTMHDIVLRASYEIDAFGHLTRKSLSAIERAVKFDENIIYAVLHEPAYCQGTAADWSCERVLREMPEFELDRQDGPIFFTGEMVFPWMFEDYDELRQLRDVAEGIAQFSDWPALYDEEQLARNQVPVYAASYTRDMYVDFDFATRTAKKIRNSQILVTNVLFHDALRSRTKEVVDEVFKLRDDEIE